MFQQHERTNDGDFEYITYHHFKAVSYDRHMSWKAGDGSIAWGTGTTTREKANEPGENKILPRDNGALIVDTTFKLTRA